MSESSLRSALGDRHPSAVPPMTSGQTSIARWKAGLVGLVLGAGSLTLVAAGPFERGALADEAAASRSDVASTVELADPNAGFATVAQAVVPGVVRIETRRSAPPGRDVTPSVPPGFENFFRSPAPRAPRIAVSGGTGFLVDRDGLILTNHHVVDDADAITVWLHDRRSFEAELIGSDPTTDVAVLRIEGVNLPALTLGDSDRLRVGEWVLAIGNPGFQGGRPLDETVTFGIVSALGRPLSVIRSELARDPDDRGMAEWAIEDFIQTDAVINPGNSGGPLVDMSGRVVGMNSAIASTSGYYQGYGFAIPIDLVRGVMDDLVEHGRVRRGWLGIQISDVVAEDAEVYGLSEIAGVLVQGVTPEGPGEEGGLRPGDVIIEVDGHPIDRVGGLQQRIARADPGSRVPLTVMREGDRMTIDVRLGEAPLASETARPVGVEESHAGEALGLRFSELTPSLQRTFGLEGAGVVVTEVDPRGPAMRRGVGVGAKVVEVNGTEVSGLDDVERALARVRPGDVVTFVLADRNGNSWIANVRARDARGGVR